MIIVNQERNGAYNFDNAKSIDVVDNGIYITDDILADRGTRIAIYETEERAKEILEEITLAYANMEMLKIPKIDIYQKISAIEMVRNICYKMPEE